MEEFTAPGRFATLYRRRPHRDRQLGGRAGTSRRCAGAQKLSLLWIDGGESAAAIYTLLGTARLNGVDPERWLRRVSSCIADHPLARIEELTWNMSVDLQRGPEYS